MPLMESVETASQRFRHLLGVCILVSHMRVLDCLFLSLLEVSSRVESLPPSPKSTQHWEMGYDGMEPGDQWLENTVGSPGVPWAPLGYRGLHWGAVGSRGEGRASSSPAPHPPMSLSPYSYHFLPLLYSLCTPLLPRPPF